MKKNQIKELRSKDTKELSKMLSNHREDLSKIMVDLRSRKLRNVAIVANKKKSIAIISTLIKEKEQISV